ncbi:hypothetical protein JTE90_007260 [Oedothorax gibbosus]|uniref:Uncharacterized protein n=1 Tax=Oedothorax gibbosus TaxID=931172 RepID=A0AAV6VP88_9ARAC|nr:hypothetical protein JTE90_007260 [Oedothorax gibbosus]
MNSPSNIPCIVPSSVERPEYASPPATFRGESSSHAIGTQCHTGMTICCPRKPLVVSINKQTPPPLEQTCGVCNANRVAVKETDYLTVIVRYDGTES